MSKPHRRTFGDSALALIAPALTVTALSPSGVSAQNEPAQATRKQDFEEVVVTAQRREERLQEVPISISVLAGERLDKDASEAVNDIISRVAGVYSYETGQNGGAKFSIRGVTSNSSLFNGSSTVGYYLDEVPFGFNRLPVSPDANAYDLERVEVLRGPQGTLYGVNSVNGVIRIITKDADPGKFEAKARASLSTTKDGGENYRGDAAVNIPLIRDKLAMRATVGRYDASGWVDQPNAGRKDVNDVETTTFRLKLNAAPTENLTASAIVWLNRDDRGGPSAALDGRIQLTTQPQPLSTDYDLYGLTLGYQFPTFTVSSATSYIDYENVGKLENAGFQLTTALFAKLFSQEIRLNSTGAGPLQWSAGAIYRDEKDPGISDLPQIFVFPAIATTQSRSFAVFGELKYGFADGLFDVTAGLRYFEDDTSQFEESRFFTGPPANPIRSKRTFDAVTPRFVLSAHPSENLDLYASYGQGFRSGFDQNTLVLAVAPDAPPIKEDLLTNYEIGAKGMAFDRRVSFEAAAYYIDWKDSPQTILQPFGTVSIAVPTNSEDLQGFGVDLSLALALTDRWRLSATGSWNDLHFAADVTSGTATLFREGERPDESPRMTLGGRVDYRKPVGTRLDLGLSAGASYTTKVSNRVLVGQDVIRLYGDNLLIADARISLGSTSGWAAALFAENLLDKDPRVRVFGNPTNRNLDSRIRPRTIGLQVEYTF